MPKCRVEILRAAWQDMDKISDFYIRMVGKASAQRMMAAILETIRKLGDFPYMGAQHPDPELARLEYRKVICGDYVCVYKVVEKTVYVYRVVNGKTDYPKLLK
jgi:plasmid stabilization system protein ParE